VPIAGRQIVRTPDLNMIFLLDNAEKDCVINFPYPFSLLVPNAGTNSLPPPRVNPLNQNIRVYNYEHLLPLLRATVMMEVTCPSETSAILYTFIWYIDPVSERASTVNHPAIIKSLSEIVFNFAEMGSSNYWMFQINITVLGRIYGEVLFQIMFFFSLFFFSF
jgi:hypothetical protein